MKRTNPKLTLIHYTLNGISTSIIDGIWHKNDIEVLQAVLYTSCIQEKNDLYDDIFLKLLSLVENVVFCKQNKNEVELIKDFWYFLKNYLWYFRILDQSRIKEVENNLIVKLSHHMAKINSREEPVTLNFENKSTPINTKKSPEATTILFIIQFLKDSNKIPERAKLEEWKKLSIVPHSYHLLFSVDDSKIETYIKLSAEISVEKIYC